MKDSAHRLPTAWLFLFPVLAATALLMTGAIFSLSADSEPDKGFLAQFIVNLPACLAIAAVNVWLIWLMHRRTGSRSGMPVRILLDLLITSSTALLIPFGINCMVMPPREALVNSLAVIPWNWFIVLMAETLFYTTEKDRIEKEKIRYQYEALKNQVDPHFLFNCLNVLSSLVYHDADKANLFAKELSKVYRYVLDTRMRESVTLAEELNFVRSYLFLESIRFDGRVRVRMEENPAVSRRLVLPASTQMLVENAFKHNVNTEESPLEISITADEDGICVSNKLQPKNHVSGHGTGLRILRQQYALHGKRIVISRDGGRFSVRLPFIG